MIRAERSSLGLAHSPPDETLTFALERLPAPPSATQLWSLLAFDAADPDGPVSFFSFGLSDFRSFFASPRSLSLLSLRSEFSFRERRSLRVSLYFLTFSFSFSFSSFGGGGSFAPPTG